MSVAFLQFSAARSEAVLTNPDSDLRMKAVKNAAITPPTQENGRSSIRLSPRPSVIIPFRKLDIFRAADMPVLVNERA